MAKKRSFYSSLKELTAVPLKNLKPIHVEHGRRRLQMSRTRRVMTVIVICLCLLVITVAVGRSWGPLNTVVNAVASPFQTAFNAVGDWLEAGRRHQQDLDLLTEENASMQKELDMLRYNAMRDEEQLEALAELQALYDLDQYYADYPKTGAQIISYSTDNWASSATIDKGNADGVKQYMPLLADGGLYGHIETVYEHYSRITSILSPESAVYCEVFRSGDRVSVEGDVELVSKDLCRIIFDLGTVDIAVGDEIVTSSYSSVYPPGIRVGEVTEVNESGDTITGIAYVRPFASINNASYVLLITDAAAKPAEEPEP